jgi:hypothetical protein
MKPHIKIYLDYFDLGMQDEILCEGCMRPDRVDGEANCTIFSPADD